MIREKSRATDERQDATVASSSQSPPTGTARAEDRAESAVEETKRQAAAGSDQLKQQAGEVAEMAKVKASETAHRAKESGRQYAYEKKSRAAAEIGVFSGAIRKAADKLHEEEHDSIANYVDYAAEQLDQVRDSLESKRVSEIVDDVQDFARRRPEIVYGGLFVAGLAAMRFLKASAPTRHIEHRDLSDDSQRPATAFGHAPKHPTTARPVPVATAPGTSTSTAAGYGQTRTTNDIGGTRA